MFGCLIGCLIDCLFGCKNVTAQNISKIVLSLKSTIKSFEKQKSLSQTKTNQ